MKAYMAAPPEVLRVNEKHKQEYYIPNCCLVIITTNYKTDGIYIAEDDRRHYVAWSDLTEKDFPDGFLNEMWHWYEHEGGFAHVTAYLDARDLSGFNAKAPPPKTQAFWDIVYANRAPEEAELNDVLDKLERPDAVTLQGIINKASEIAVKDEDGREDKNSLSAWLKERKNRRAIPHRLEKCKYVSVPNPYAKDGLWKRNGARQMIYGPTRLSPADRLKAAQRLPGLDRQQEGLF
jgi:hypothetical protein